MRVMTVRDRMLRAGCHYTRLLGERKRPPRGILLTEKREIENVERTGAVVSQQEGCSLMAETK